MAIFKCKMCGGDLEIKEGMSVGECEYCGTKQTLPRLTDDKKANMYDRANHFRRNNEFDKAEGIYEQILNEDATDSEAYWSLVLCRYGIEYVEDPATHKRIPTVNRAQFTSVFDDDNYKSAIEYADDSQRAIYEEEAAAINNIQKGILAISQKEEPFDVFICYKETDNSGARTHDSVLANDLYHQLTNEGLKVFFARITLEDKLGSEYEPYIFAALNSAKVMVVLGTKPEYFNAPWVRNEWSRYLALVKQSGGKRMLIPAYKEMDPYDLPDEFSHLQAQDMSKLGFMQDLIRGIKKILNVDEAGGASNGAAAKESEVPKLLKRVFLFLEDGNWQEADEYCERVLDQDPENASAYLGKLMVELHVDKPENLAFCEKPFDDNKNFDKAVRYGDENLRNSLNGYIDAIKGHIEDMRRSEIYNKACALMDSQDEEEIMKAIPLFESISGWRDADDLAKQCPALSSKARDMSVSEKVSAANTIGKVNALMDKHPDYWIIPWRGVELIMALHNTDDLAFDSAKTQEKHKIDKVLNGPLDVEAFESVGGSQTLLRAAGDMKRIAGKWHDFPQAAREDADSYLKKALSLAGDNAAQLQEKWDKYISDVENVCNEKEQYYTGLFDRINVKNAEYEEQEAQLFQVRLKKRTVTSGIVTGVIALFSLIMIIAAFYAKQTANKPERILPYSTLWYTVIACVIALAAGGLFRWIQLKIIKFSYRRGWSYCDSPDPRLKIKRFKILGIVNKSLVYVTMVASVAAVVFSIISAVNFKHAIGTIHISSADDIIQMRRHPEAYFDLTEDIDLKGKTLKSFWRFSGKLDGQGHTISNFEIDEYVFRKVSGEITNLKFKTVTFSKEAMFIKKNKGKLEYVTVDGITPKNEDITWYGLIKNNYGKVENTGINNVKGKFGSFTGFAETNEDDGTIVNCQVKGLAVTAGGAAGFVGTNDGTVEKCVLQGNITAKYNAYAFIRSNAGTIEKCCAYGNIVGGDDVSGFVGSFTAGKIVDSCSMMAVKLNINTSDSDVSGFVCALEPKKKLKTPMLIERCEYAGKITVAAGEGGSGYGHLGGFICSDGNSYLSGQHALTIRNSLCLSTYTLNNTHQNSYSNASCITKLENFYGISDHDYDKTMRIDGALTRNTPANIKTRAVIVDKLKWSDTVWNVKNGSVPTLKGIGILPVKK